MTEKQTENAQFNNVQLYQVHQQNTTSLQIGPSIYEKPQHSQGNDQQNIQIEGIAYFIQLHKQQMQKQTRKVQQALYILNNEDFSQSQKIQKTIAHLNDLETSTLYPHIDPAKSIVLQSPDSLQKEIRQKYTLQMISQKDLMINLKQQQIIRLQQINKQLNQQFLKYSTEKQMRILQLQGYQRNYQQKQVQQVNNLSIHNSKNLVQTEQMRRMQKQLQITQKELQSMKQLIKIQMEKVFAKESILKKGQQSEMILKRQLTQLKGRISEEREEFNKKQQTLLQKITKLQQKCIEQSIKSIQIPLQSNEQQLNEVALENQQLKLQIKVLKASLDEQKRHNQDIIIKNNTLIEDLQKRNNQLVNEQSQKQNKIQFLKKNHEKIIKQNELQKQHLKTQFNILCQKIKQLQIARQTLILQGEYQRQQLTKQINNLNITIKDNNQSLKEISVIKNQQKLNQQELISLRAQIKSLNIQLQDKNVHIQELSAKIQKDQAERILMIHSCENIKKEMQQVQELRKQAKKLLYDNEKVIQKYQVLKQRYRKDTKNTKQGFFRHMKSLMAQMNPLQLFSFKEAIKMTFWSSEQ